VYVALNLVATLHAGYFRQFYRAISVAVLYYFRNTDRKMLQWIKHQHMHFLLNTILV